MFGLFGPSVPQIPADEVAELLRSPNPPHIVDVREPGEFTSGHIPGAVLISLGTLEARAHEIPRDRDVIMVCRSGARSGQATRFLASQGYQVRNMVGGMMAWSGPVE